MKLFLTCAALFTSLSACTKAATGPHDQLMDLVEAGVKLPEGAKDLSAYARHYGVDEKGLGIAIYAPGYRAPSPDLTCEEVLENLATRSVSCPEIESDELLAGERHWDGPSSKLPNIMDGGCSIVTVIFDMKSGTVEDVYCNGIA